MRSNLNKLENESIFIFRQAYRSIPNIALLWSLGKDSNVMIWLAFKAFLGKIPFPVVHVDTGKKFKEKKYFKHTGHPGGIKEFSPLRLKEKNKTEEILKLAVKRMLPGGPLAKKEFRALEK